MNAAMIVTTIYEAQERSNEYISNVREKTGYKNFNIKKLIKA